MRCLAVPLVVFLVLTQLLRTVVFHAIVQITLTECIFLGYFGQTLQHLELLVVISCICVVSIQLYVGCR